MYFLTQALTLAIFRLRLLFSNTGLSFRFIRSQIANIITTTLARKGIRHPQAISCSRSSAKNITAQIAVALNVPQLVPIATSEEMIPRFPFGAYSASIVPAPEISAPAPSPCIIRNVTSNTGAKNADLRIRRQYANQRGADPHHGDGNKQYFFFVRFGRPFYQKQRRR